MARLRTATLATVAMLSVFPSAGRAATRDAPSAGEIQLELEQLARAGRVLYVAAHPDDENTRLLAHLVGERGLRSAYVSITRGAGGQNRLGPEQGELLGVVRTLELLEARAHDGAEQYFTRARDFGFSKTASETLSIWGEERTLGDLVRVIRRFRPDVVVTRFPPNEDEEEGGHGHHAASARLARRAMEAAGDPDRFPEQLDELEAWQPERLLYNVSTWDLPDDADMSGYMAIEAGGFEPRLGRSWNEIEATARSMHKSQGFGMAPERGAQQEYFEHLAGRRPEGDPFEDGLELSWRRFEGGGPVDALLSRAAETFEPKAPHRTIPILLAAERAMASLPAVPRRDDARRDLHRLVADCAGLWLAARAPTASVTRGGTVELSVKALARSPAEPRLEALTLPGGRRIEVDEPLTEGKVHERTIELDVPDDARLAVPHWLAEPARDGFHRTRPEALIGAPDTPAALRVGFELAFDGQRVAVERDVRHAWTHRVHGQQTRRVEVLPAVTATPEEDVLALANGSSGTLHVRLRASASSAEGTLRVELPEGWEASPSSPSFSLDEAGAERTLAIEVTPPEDATGIETLRLVVDPASEEPSSWARTLIDYPHIPTRTVLRPAEVRLAPVSIAGTDRSVGYVPGAGDRVAESLRQVGYEVSELDPTAIGDADLDAYDTIVTGVRAFNVHEALRRDHDVLMDWVERGGRLVVQYNKHSEWNPLELDPGPYPLQIGRSRVTDETAEVRPIDPEHPLLNRPNELTDADFEGWVQERGLYFAESWDDRYQPVLAMADPGEEPLRGSLLVAEHGDGVFLYTGLAFFRQLPAGVPGAYRLLANLIAHEP